MKPEQLELERLRQYASELQAAADDFAHQIRRCQDMLERAGGRAAATESRLHTLRKNSALTLTELEDINNRIQKLRARRRAREKDSA